MKSESLSSLLAFRQQVYQQFSRRADALFEMLDALLVLPSATAPAHMMLQPQFQRKWGSVYDALAAGCIDGTGVEALVAQYPLDGGEDVYAIDTSTWMKNDAETSPKRGYYHHHNRHSAGKPIVAGWAYQWLAQVSFRHDSWCAPLSVERVQPTDNMHQVAATQIRALLKRRTPHTSLPIFVFDAGYDAVQLAHLLTDEPLGLLVRLRSNRCFYAEPEERESGGRPRIHGDKFAFHDPQTWGEPTMEFLTADPQYGRVHIQAWPAMHAKPDQHATRGTSQPRPVIPGRRSSGSPSQNYPNRHANRSRSGSGGMVLSPQNWSASGRPIAPDFNKSISLHLPNISSIGQRHESAILNKRIAGPTLSC